MHWLLLLMVFVPTPVQATPFDFSAPYNWDWQADGPILLLSTSALGVSGRITVRPFEPSPFREPIRFSVFTESLPPACQGCALTWSGIAHVHTGVGPFREPDARFSLVGEVDGWALKGFNDDRPVEATPEPATLLLVGTGAAVLGLARWCKRRRQRTS